MRPSISRVLRPSIFVLGLAGIVACGPAPGSFCDLSTPLPASGDQQADADRQLIRAVACLNAQASDRAALAGLAGAAAVGLAAEQSSVSQSLSVQSAVFSQSLTR